MHRGRQYDRKAMSTEEGRAKLCDICEAIPLQPWGLDADTHYHNVQEFIVSRLAEAFPPGRRKRVESVIFDATWVIKDHRLWLRRQTAAQRRRVKQQELLASFRAWQKHRDITVSRCVVMAWTCAEACQAASFVQQLRRSRMELRRAIRKDHRDFVERLARETAESSAKEVLCRMRPLLRCAGKKRGGNRALPATQLEDGTLAMDEVQALDRWVRHFASIEGGERVSPAVLVCDRQARLQCAREPVEIHLGEVPTRICLERACHNVACGKAMGPDAVPGELMRHASRSISKPIYQLMLKLALRGDEPTIFKGGIVYAAWKGRGAQAVCANHRGLLVSSVVGKTIHAAIRRKLIPVLDYMASPLQVGGLPRFPVAYAAHAARLFQSAFRQSNYFILFLDLKEAFYRLARPLLTSEQPSDESFARLFAALQLPQPVFAAFRHAVCSEPALKTSGATEWVQMVISEMLQQTRFSLPGQGDVVRTCLGSRPGDGLADILFSLVFADVLVTVRSELQGVESLCILWDESMRGSVQETATASAQPDIGFLDVSWMDDLAILGACSTAKEAPEVLATTAGILIDTCLSRGMFPNLDRNKTEVIVGLRGKGAHAVRKALLSDTEPRLLTTSRCWPEQRIRVVASYKHLGGILHHQGRLEAEAKTRAGLAWAAFNKHKRTVFCQHHVRLQDKVVIFQSLVLSVLFYGCGTWGELELKARARLNRAYLSMGRVLLRRHFDGDVSRLSDARVLAHLGLPDFQVWVHFYRLSYVTSFVSLDVKEMWALAHTECKWLCAVRQSLEWLWEQVDRGRRATTRDSAWATWKRDICQAPKKWKRLLRFARESATRVGLIEEGWQQCRGTLVQGLLGMGAHAEALQDRKSCGPQACAVCQKLFPSKQAWSVHAFKVHGRVKQSRLLVDGCCCPICLKVFPTNIRLCNHVGHSRPCRKELLRQGFSCLPQPGVGNSRAEIGDLFLGVSRQGFGPLPSGNRQHAVVVPWLQSSETWQCLVRTLDMQLEADGLAQVLNSYRLALCVQCLDWGEIEEITSAWRHFVSVELSEAASIHSAAIHHAAATWLAEHVTPEWLCPEPQAGGALLATFRQSVECLALLDLADVSVDQPTAPALAGGCMVCDEATLRVVGGHFRPGWVALLNVIEDTRDWCAVFEDQVRLRSNCLHLLCLVGLQLEVMVPAGPLKASTYRVHRLRSTVVQDAITTFFRLWRCAFAVIAVLPQVDPAVCAVIRRLPGVSCWDRGTYIIAHNGPPDRVPVCVFHLFAN